MKSKIVCSIAALMVCAVVAVAETPAKTPKVGDMAPKIEGKDQNGKTWKLEDALGKNNVLLYFYPKDNTPGCTKEACGFRDQMDKLKKDDVEVVGVSIDNGESHLKFIDDFKLNFNLLQDTD